MKRLIHYEYKRPGKSTAVFDQWLVLDRPDVKVLLLEHHSGRAIGVGRNVILEPRAPALWFVFPGAWHDVGRFHLADGTFTGWYTNICTPVEMHGDTWSSTDLFLDHWLSVSGEQEWLDHHEYLSAVRFGLVDLQTRAKVTAERDEIDRKARARQWPPRIVMDMNLQDGIALARDGGAD